MKKRVITVSDPKFFRFYDFRRNNAIRLKIVETEVDFRVLHSND